MKAASITRATLLLRMSSVCPLMPPLLNMATYSWVVLRSSAASSLLFSLAFSMPAAAASSSSSSSLSGAHHGAAASRGPLSRCSPPALMAAVSPSSCARARASSALDAPSVLAAAARG